MTAGFSTELADDPFSPRRLRLLQALADVIFAHPPADAAAQQENDELITAFAQLFFPGLPEEQARSFLPQMVSALLAEAEERGGLAERAGSNSQLDELGHQDQGPAMSPRRRYARS